MFSKEIWYLTSNKTLWIFKQLALFSGSTLAQLGQSTRTWLAWLGISGKICFPPCWCRSVFRVDVTCHSHVSHYLLYINSGHHWHNITANASCSSTTTFPFGTVVLPTQASVLTLFTMHNSSLRDRKVLACLPQRLLQGSFCSSHSPPLCPPPLWRSPLLLVLDHKGWPQCWQILCSSYCPDLVSKGQPQSDPMDHLHFPCLQGSAGPPGARPGDWQGPAQLCQNLPK